MSPVGTSPTSCRVRYLAADPLKAGIAAARYVHVHVLAFQAADRTIESEGGGDDE
jgi:hypothetical protein